MLTEGRKLILGGIDIPYEKGLLGHSDADVLTHALMDALLGAAAMGDIGKLFPDNDPAYEGISSLKLLGKVISVLDDSGYTVGNADITVICERPKLSGYIEQIREKLAETMGQSAFVSLAPVPILICIISVVLIGKFKVNPILIVIGSGLIGAFLCG